MLHLTVLRALISGPPDQPVTGARDRFGPLPGELRPTGKRVSACHQPRLSCDTPKPTQTSTDAQSFTPSRCVRLRSEIPQRHGRSRGGCAIKLCGLV